MIYDKENIFAKILRKEIPCETVFENDFILAFKDINPQAKIHILIIPKGEYVDISDFIQSAPLNEISSFWKSVDELLVNLNLKDKGFQIKTHKGKDGGQEVFHFHLHLLSNN
jgi:diadenosine tetraphosphate (Ap4A) HIT family hydrolase